MARLDNEVTLREALTALFNRPNLKTGYRLSRIQTAWPRIFGPTVALYTRSMTIDRRRLFIAIESAPLRDRLSRMREELRVRLNEELGEEYLKEVVVR